MIILTVLFETQNVLQCLILIQEIVHAYIITEAVNSCSLSSGKHVHVLNTPFNPTFIQKKLGYAGVYLFFLFLLQNVHCGYSLESPCRGGSNVYLQSMF